MSRSRSLASLESPEPVAPDRHDTDDYNDSWNWPEDLTKMVKRQLNSPSLNVCARGTPHADLNLDKDPHDGVDIQGDMFNLPFETEAFESVVSDPPWLAKSASERRRMFKEVLRVTRPGGLIIYNSSWIPKDEWANLRSERIRQDKGFFHNSSFLFMFTKAATADDVAEVYDVEDSSVSDDALVRHIRHGLVDPDQMTDPRIVIPGNDYTCPECGHSSHRHVMDEGLSACRGYQFNLYQCQNDACGFRATADEIYDARDTRLSAMESSSEAGVGTLPDQSPRSAEPHPGRLYQNAVSGGPAPADD